MAIDRVDVIKGLIRFMVGVIEAIREVESGVQKVGSFKVRGGGDGEAEVLEESMEVFPQAVSGLGVPVGDSD